MGGFWIFLVIFVLAVPAILFTGISAYKKHCRFTGGIINYDAFMNKYVYKVPMTKSEIISTLNVRNVADELFCTLDLEKSAIVFTDHNDSKEYLFYIQENEGFSILKLEQDHVSVMKTQSYIPYKLNPFMIGKLHAEIIPFEQYRF